MGYKGLSKHLHSTPKKILFLKRLACFKRSGVKEKDFNFYFTLAFEYI